MVGYHTYEIKKNLHPIWDKNKAPFEGSFYRIVEEYHKSEPVYRSDYIEPYEYKDTRYVTIENIETGERTSMDWAYFRTIFDVCNAKYVEEEEK